MKPTEESKTAAHGEKDRPLAEKRALGGLGTSPSAELTALGASVRAVLDAMLRIDDAPAALDAARHALDEAARRLAPHAPRGDALRLGRPGEPEGARPYLVDGVMLPAHHPLAADVRIETRNGVTRGDVAFGVVFEGPPGCVHGGHVASFFDQILGHHTLTLELPAMTASLHVQYRRPTPLFTRLDFEVRIAAVAGRKISVHGKLEAEGTLVAEAEGLFILPSGAVTDQLRGLVR